MSIIIQSNFLRWLFFLSHAWLKNQNLDHAIAQASQWLQERAIENPKREAMLILAHVLQRDYLEIVAGPVPLINKKKLRQFWQMIKKRGRGMPFAYITGVKEFFSLPFFIHRGVLIPRPTSEGICQAVIDNFQPNTQLTICDLGTGSGCLLITLLKHFQQATGIGIDVSRRALGLVKKNADHIGVADRMTLLRKNIKNKILLNKKFHVVVANPPYITKPEYATLARNIFFEPKEALLANDHAKKNDGLFFYPLIKKFSDEHLAKDGLLVIECAPRQKRSVAKIFAPARYKTIIIV